MFLRASLRLAVALGLGLLVARAQQLAVAPFDADATPAPGSSLAYDPMTAAGDLTLRCRGVVIRGAGDPIVLAAIDWIGVANASHDAFRDLLAAAAGTTRSRVAIHALHQHDAPVADSTSERVLASRGIAPGCFHSDIVRPAMLRASNAVARASTNMVSLTHVGWGQAEVFQVASNRRVPGTNGFVRAVRYTATPDAALRAAPEGLVDPLVVAVGLWSHDKPVAVLTYYATHPQSFYRTGIAHPDFPGIARFLRDQALPGTLHVHFNGAGGNLGAGKYNDGNPTNRPVLARHLADGMERAWKGMQRHPLTTADVGWSSEVVQLPLAPHLKSDELDAALRRPSPALYVQAAQLAFVERRQQQAPTDVSCLRLGDIRILHLPGELFVEYQLAARLMRPDLHVAMAAYGDYGAQYIGTEKAYGLGGYETEPRSSGVAPSVQRVLFPALQRLLAAP